MWQGCAGFISEPATLDIFFSQDVSLIVWLQESIYMCSFFPNSKPTPFNLHGLYVRTLQLPNVRPDAVLRVHNSTGFQSCSWLTWGTPDCEDFSCYFFQTAYSRSLHIMAHESHSEHLTGHLCYVYSRKKTSLFHMRKLNPKCVWKKSKEKE